MPNRRTSKNIAHRAWRRQQRDKRKSLKRIEFLMKYGGAYLESAKIGQVIDCRKSGSPYAHWLLLLSSGQHVTTNNALCNVRPKPGEVCTMYYSGSPLDPKVMGCRVAGRTYAAHPDLPILIGELGFEG